MTPSDSKSYLGYLNKLVYKYNDTYHRYIGRIPLHADYLDLTQETSSSHKAPKFKFGDRGTITKYKNIFSKSYTKNSRQSKEL